MVCLPSFPAFFRFQQQSLECLPVTRVHCWHLPFQLAPDPAPSSFVCWGEVCQNPNVEQVPNAHWPREGQAVLLSPVPTPYLAQLIPYFPTHETQVWSASCALCDLLEDLCEIWARHRSEFSRQGKSAAICIYELFLFLFFRARVCMYMCVYVFVWDLHNLPSKAVYASCISVIFLEMVDA